MFVCFFWPVYGFIDRTDCDMTVNRMRERERSDTQQRGPGRDSNPGPLQKGQSPRIWDARSTNWAKWRLKITSLISREENSDFYIRRNIFLNSLTIRLLESREVTENVQRVPVRCFLSQTHQHTSPALQVSGLTGPRARTQKPLVFWINRRKVKTQNMPRPLSK